MKKGKVLQKTILWISSVLMLLGLSVVPVAQALEVPDLTRTGEIIVTVKDTQDRLVTGGELAAYRVADLKVLNQADYYLDPTGSFKSVLQVTDIDSEDELTHALAKTLSETAANLTPDYTGTVGENGILTFTNLPLGFYLVVETKPAEGYTTLEPFLVTVPYRNDDGSYEYNVDAFPKETLLEPPVPTPTPTPTPTPPPNLPQTGQLWWPVPLLAGIGLIFLIIGLIRKKGTPSKKVGA